MAQQFSGYTNGLCNSRLRRALDLVLTSRDVVPTNGIPDTLSVFRQPFYVTHYTVKVDKNDRGRIERPVRECPAKSRPLLC